MIPFIKRAQHLGFSVGQIDELLDLAGGGPDSADTSQTLAETWIADLNTAQPRVTDVTAGPASSLCALSLSLGRDGHAGAEGAPTAAALVGTPRALAQILARSATWWRIPS